MQGRCIAAILSVGVMMISHDAFLLLCTLIDLGGEATKKELTKAVGNRVDNLRISDFLEELTVSRYIYLDISRYKLDISRDIIELYITTKNITREARSSAVENLVSRNVKYANSSYRGVVNGTRPSRMDAAAQRFAERFVSRGDLPEFWKMVGDMDDQERRNFDVKITRMVARSR